MVIAQIAYGPIPDALTACVASVRAAWPEHEYRLVELPAISDPIARCVASDATRFALAAEIGPQMAYFDLDCTIVDPFTFGTGPHFAHRRGKPSCHAFYGVGAEFVTKLRERMAKRGIVDTTYCWPAKVLRDMPGIGIIPDEYIAHMAYTRNGAAA